MSPLIGQVVLVLIALISASGGIYATVVSRRKTEADTEQTTDQTWIARLEALSRDLGKLQLLSDERLERLVVLETLITDHLDWDFEVVRVLRKYDIAVDDPPSLVYVRRKLAEEKNAIQREMGSEQT